MGELFGAAVGFPGVVFSSALAVVVCFWLLVVLGLTCADVFDDDADLDGVGLGGVPVSLAVSLFVGGGWAASVAGSAAMAHAGLTGLAHAAVDLGLLLTSALLAWALTRTLVRPLSRRLAPAPGPSPRDLVGAVGTVRTGPVDAESGQAEVVAPDGSVVVVEVRRRRSAPAEALTPGAAAVLYAYDEAGAFFWAAPASVALAPGRHPATARAREPRAPETRPVGDDWPRADCA
ncbi:hypothetical protein RB200_32680 [Streptomyces sp. PmtG]